MSDKDPHHHLLRTSLSPLSDTVFGEGSTSDPQATQPPHGTAMTQIQTGPQRKPRLSPQGTVPALC